MPSHESVLNTINPPAASKYATLQLWTISYSCFYVFFPFSLLAINQDLLPEN